MRTELLVTLAFTALAGCGGAGGSDDDPMATATPTPTPTATSTSSPTPTVVVTPVLADEGARIFFQETFEGNGRTCGTCHSASAGFTLTPRFVAGRRDDDPLFVAARDPGLAALENLDLLRGPRVLVLENPVGFDQPPVFRGTPHLFNLAFTAPYGWNGNVDDLRAFAPQAVRQHFPRTLGRVAGEDFRLPTEPELDALVAYMLSVETPADGDTDLDGFVRTAAEARGRDLFFGTAKCSSCHNGIWLTDNGSFATGVTRQSVDVVPPPECEPPCPAVGPLEDRGGEQTFNVPTLFGLANTAPYFHDDSAATIRDAVAFYTTPAFAESSAGGFIGPITLSATEIDDVAAFLTALSPCGNGVADHGEPCDDGNQEIGDGCRPTCTVERCGDGIVDPQEECDDANLVTGDGCDGCRLEH